MAVHNPYDKMRQNAIMTTAKEDLTLMLYDGALKFANQAITALENKDYMKCNELVIRTQNIIREFQLTLNAEFEISGYFASMYEYIYRRLLEGNTAKDVTILKEARDLIRDFRDMWKEAMVLAKTSPAGTPAATTK